MSCTLRPPPRTNFASLRAGAAGISEAVAGAVSTIVRVSPPPRLPVAATAPTATRPADQGRGDGRDEPPRRAAARPGERAGGLVHREQGLSVASGTGPT